MTLIRKISYEDSANLDAFARLRTSSPRSIFDSKQVVNNQPLYWDDQQTSGTGTSSAYNTNQASSTIAVGASTAGTRVRQTYRWFNYQPGKSTAIIMTGVFGSNRAGITRRVGQFNSQNGLFFEQISTGMGVVRRTFTSGVAVDDRVAQDDWNIDTMDGNGPSGIDLDFTLSQIFFIDYEWLGVGRVRLGFFVDGQPYYCHEFLNANVLSLVYMSTPNLPLRYEISNDGTGVASNLVCICSTVISEGGSDETGYPFGMTRGSTALTTNNNANLYPLIAFRLRSGYSGSTVRPSSFSITCTSSATYCWYLIINPTVTGTAFSYTTLTNSSIEYDVSRTSATTVSAGTVIASGVAQQTNEGRSEGIIANDYALGSSISGTSDVLVLAVQRVTGTSETFFASVNILDKQ